VSCSFCDTLAILDLYVGPRHLNYHTPPGGLVAILPSMYPALRYVSGLMASLPIEQPLGRMCKSTNRGGSGRPQPGSVNGHGYPGRAAASSENGPMASKLSSPQRWTTRGAGDTTCMVDSWMPLSYPKPGPKLGKKTSELARVREGAVPDLHAALQQHTPVGAVVKPFGFTNIGQSYLPVAVRFVCRNHLTAYDSDLVTRTSSPQESCQVAVGFLHAGANYMQPHLSFSFFSFFSFFLASFHFLLLLCISCPTIQRYLTCN